MIKRFIASLLVFLSLLLVPATAQDSTVVKTRLIFATGVCFISDSTINDLAYAHAGPIPCPAIVLNTAALRDFPEHVVGFILLHEIAHIYKNHMPSDDFYMRQNQEAEADCEAAKMFKNYYPYLVAQLLADIPKAFNPNPIHGDVETRLNRITGCMNQ